jgi:hypothetical protein
MGAEKRVHPWSFLFLPPFFRQPAVGTCTGGKKFSLPESFSFRFPRVLVKAIEGCSKVQTENAREREERDVMTIPAFSTRQVSRLLPIGVGKDPA